MIAEGLMMYLSPESVKTLFCQSAASAGEGSRVLFSYIPTGADGRPDAGPRTGLMLWLQKAAGEPWLWSIHPEALGPYLAQCGWQIDKEQKWAASKYGVEYFVVAVKAGDDRGKSND